MPSSSITPYMCSVSGPRLKALLEGEGMEPRIGRSFPGLIVPARGTTLREAV